MKTLITIAMLLGLATPGLGAWPSENEWAKKNVQKFDAVNGVRLWDGTVCDYMTETHAIEIDWAANGKWAEAVGQAIYYATVLKKRPGIIMLTKWGLNDRAKALQKGYVYRCQTVCAQVGIHLWVVRVMPLIGKKPANETTQKPAGARKNDGGNPDLPK